MTRPARHLFLAAASAAVLLPSVASAATSANWPGYLGGPSHSSYNPGATAITTSKASALTAAWSWKPAAPTHPGQPGAGLVASPTVFGGRVYLGATTGVFYALNESTGAVVWHRYLGFLPKTTCRARGIDTTATVAPSPTTGRETVYVAGALGKLSALDAATGAVVWQSSVVTPSATVNDYYLWSSPTVYGGRVYIGIASNCDNPLVQGGVKAYDQASGQLDASYSTVPAGAVGGSVWTSVAADSTGVYVTTGNADQSGASPPGDSNSVVRLDLATLARIDSWTVPNITALDDDFGASPTLFTASLNGQPTPMVGACNKNGIFYALRASNLAVGPVWRRMIGGAASTAEDFCLGAAVWDGSRLYLASNRTTIGGVSYPGSIRELNPATGAIIWARGLSAGPIWATPTLNGAGVLSVVSYDKATMTANALFLVNAATGGLLAQRPLGGPAFAQPVVADAFLFTAARGTLQALH